MSLPRGPWPSPVGVGTALALAGLVLGGLLLPAAPAAVASESPEVELRLSELTGVLGPETDAVPEQGEDHPDPVLSHAASVGEDLGLRLLVSNRGEQAVEGLRVVVEIHPAVASRDELAAAFEGEGFGTPTGPIHDTEVRGLDALEPGEVAGVEETVPADQAGWSEGGGVHPLRVSLVRGAEVLDELVTAVVWLGDATAEPVLTTFVWPFSDNPWRTDGGHFPAAAQRNIRPGERLDVLLSALERHADTGVLLAPAAHLVEDLREQASGFVEIGMQEDGSRVSQEVAPDDEVARRAAATLQRLRDLAEELPHAPVHGPYADADLVALALHGQPMRELAGELATEGRRRLAFGLERPADASAFVLGGPVSPEALDLVPTDHLLLPATAVAEGEATDRVRRLRSDSGRPLTASVGDAGLTELLAEPELEGLAAAQRVLAETAMHYFESPGEEGRVLSLHPPRDWDPDPEMAYALLDGLADAPWLDLVSASRQASFGQRAPTEPELAEPDEDERLPDELMERLDAARTDLEAVSGATADVEEEEDGEEDEDPPARSHAELRDALFRATSSWLGGNAEAESLVRDVQSEVERTFGDVEVASGSQVTLTSDTGQIPVTVRRTRGGPITVRVEVTSQGQLVWEEQESEDLVLAGDEAHTVSFETRALGTGTFPVTVVVTDPSGVRELERTTLSVRSTAVSGPALSATGVLVLVLLLVGAVRRRPRGPRLQVVAGPDARRPPTSGHTE